MKDNPTKPPAPTTIEATAKRYKLQFLLSTLMVSLGIVVAIVSGREDVAGQLWGAGISTLGLVWYAVTRFRAWWNHG